MEKTILDWLLVSMLHFSQDLLFNQGGLVFMKILIEILRLPSNLQDCPQLPNPQQPDHAETEKKNPRCATQLPSLSKRNKRLSSTPRRHESVSSCQWVFTAPSNKDRMMRVVLSASASDPKDASRVNITTSILRYVPAI